MIVPGSAFILGLGGCPQPNFEMGDISTGRLEDEHTKPVEDDYVIQGPVRLVRSLELEGDGLHGRLSSSQRSTPRSAHRSHALILARRSSHIILISRAPSNGVRRGRASSISS